ncbi:hypothetical protein GYMLUDRAFT_73644 [Collybiopsis luxurians FD-317 M1]|uniref:Uncharacterized protein n=1 Tax=Collybiopsis luxurians FD-317 M1 TaxID=944289 RepID=A0A0D0BAP8_9AGAR|nr:hypothetical protein GYMLUDRAFT_73644 [Collybiopsis luxurians FD-317 M1]
MSSLPNHTSSTTSAGQHGLTQRNGNKHNLSVTVPRNSIQYRISLELGSPFHASFSNFSSFRDRSLSARTRRNTTLRSLESDTESEYSTEGDEKARDGDDEAQYIFIPPTSPFYRPPPRRRHPFAADISDISFSCDALSDEGSYQTPAATFFLEALGHSLPTLMREDGGEFTVDAECFEGLEKDLLLSPMDVFQDNLFSSLTSRPRYSRNSTWEFNRYFLNVPEEIEEEESVNDLEFDPFNDSASDSFYSEEGSNLEQSNALRLREPCPIIVAAPLSRRLVAPFESSSFRASMASVVPRTKFCGAFLNKFLRK